MKKQLTEAQSLRRMSNIVEGSDSEIVKELEQWLWNWDMPGDYDQMYQGIQDIVKRAGGKTVKGWEPA